MSESGSLRCNPVTASIVQQVTSPGQSLQIAFLHLPEILASFVNRHSIFDGHRSLGNIFIEGNDYHLVTFYMKEYAPLRTHRIV